MAGPRRVLCHLVVVLCLLYLLSPIECLVRWKCCSLPARKMREQFHEILTTNENQYQAVSNQMTAGLQKMIFDIAESRSLMENELTEIRRGQDGFRMYVEAQMEKILDSLKDAPSTDTDDEMPYPKDCHDILQQGHTATGLYTVNLKSLPFSVQVYCRDGWTVIQRLTDASADFYRDWQSYKEGFGSSTDGSFWIGNDILHLLTQQDEYVVHFQLVDQGGSKYAEYSNFKVASEDDLYRMTYTEGSYQGTADDGLAPSNGQAFRTKDRPTQDCGTSSHCMPECATLRQGAWWWNDICDGPNPNGPFGDNIPRYFWVSGPDTVRFSQFVEIKIRPVQ